MRVLEVDMVPMQALPMLVNSRRGPSPQMLPLHRVVVDELPGALDALLFLSDLQGRAGFDRPDVLSGISIAEQLEMLASTGALPPTKRIGVVLCGDFYAHPPGVRLGGLGDVRPVWHAFADRFRWVVGVAGNHDDFGGAKAARAFSQGDNWAVLDLEGGPLRVDFDGLSISGVSGIVGSPEKPMRRPVDDFEARVREAMQGEVDLFLSHQHPAGLGTRRPGDAALRSCLEDFSGLAAFGHKPTSEPLYRLGPECTCLVTDGRAFLLLRPED